MNIELIMGWVAEVPVQAWSPYSGQPYHCRCRDGNNCIDDVVRRNHKSRRRLRQ